MSFLFINALNSSPTSFSLTFSFTTEKCFSRLFSTTAKIIFPTRSASFFFFCFQFTYLFLVPLRPFVLHMTLCHECKAKNYAYERQISRFSVAYALILRVPTPFIFLIHRLRPHSVAYLIRTYARKERRSRAITHG